LLFCGKSTGIHPRQKLNDLDEWLIMVNKSGAVKLKHVFLLKLQDYSTKTGTVSFWYSPASDPRRFSKTPFMMTTTPSQ
jgi:hypothetical protein